LERKFRATLGRSVLDEVRTARVDRVRQLLGDTQLSMAAIAPRAGFSGSRRMAVVFRETTGVTPRQYRRQLHTQRLGEAAIKGDVSKGNVSMGSVGKGVDKKPRGRRVAK
jgi:AraC-like DNA-binding protein